MTGLPDPVKDPGRAFLATCRRALGQCGLVVLAFVFFVLAVVGLAGLTHGA